MVRVCAFPNCGNKMRRHTCLSFHRLPLGDINTLKLWLAVLQMDVNTPLHVLRLADLRVCSGHFDRVDYCQSNRRRNPTPKHLFLKKTAVPRVERPTADLVEGSDCGDVSPKESEFAAVPLSTPYRASRERSGSSRSSLSSSLILLLSSPQQSTVTPCTKQSLSGTYLARPPTWKQSLVSSRKGNVLTPVSACSEVEKSSWSKALKSLQTPHGLNIFRSSEVIVKTQCSPSHRGWRSHPSSAEPAQTFHNGAEHAVKNEDDVDEVVVQIVSSDNECSEQVFIEKDGSYLSSDDEEGSLQEEEVKKKRKFKSKDSSDEWEPCLNEEATDSDSDEDLITALKEDGQSKLVVWCTQCGTEASLSCSVLRHKKVFCCAQCSPGDGIQTYNFETLPVWFDDVASFQKHAEQEHRAKPFNILCQDCGTFVRADPESRGLKEHKCEHKSKFIICPDCGKRFLTEGGLKTHYTQLHSDYDHPCKYCLKVFKTRSAKLEHEQTHPKENQPYSCPDCPEKFSNIHKRNKHVKSHRGPHKYVCDVCEKGFKDINRLRRHKLIHSGEKPFKCQVCERSFNQIENLTSHMRVHTGEKPFICEQCGESFSHNVSLKNHKQRHHDSSLSQEKEVLWCREKVMNIAVGVP